MVAATGGRREDRGNDVGEVVEENVGNPEFKTQPSSTTGQFT